MQVGSLHSNTTPRPGNNSFLTQVYILKPVYKYFMNSSKAEPLQSVPRKGGSAPRKGGNQ